MDYILCSPSKFHLSFLSIPFSRSLSPSVLMIKTTVLELRAAWNSMTTSSMSYIWSVTKTFEQDNELSMKLCGCVIKEYVECAGSGNKRVGVKWRKGKNLTEQGIGIVRERGLTKNPTKERKSRVKKKSRVERLLTGMGLKLTGQFSGESMNTKSWLVTPSKFDALMMARLEWGGMLYPLVELDTRCFLRLLRRLFEAVAESRCWSIGGSKCVDFAAAVITSSVEDGIV